MSGINSQGLEANQEKMKEKSMKAYEQAFINKIGLSLVFFAVMALLGMLVIQLVLSEQSFLPATKLDAQTLGNFFIFIFASSVAFAGALVVIRIASKQEELAKNQLELAKKATAEYEYTQLVSNEAVRDIQTFIQRITILYNLYNYTNPRPSVEWKQVHMQVFQNYASEVIKEITDLLKYPWISRLRQYELDSRKMQTQSQLGNKNNNVPELIEIIVLANKLFCEFKLLDLLVKKLNVRLSGVTWADILAQLKHLFEGIDAFFDCLTKVHNSYQQCIDNGIFKIFNSDDPDFVAAVHQKLKGVPLKPDYNVL